MPSEALFLGIASIGAVVAGFTAVDRGPPTTRRLVEPGPAHPPSVDRLDELQRDVRGLWFRSSSSSGSPTRDLPSSCRARAWPCMSAGSSPSACGSSCAPAQSASERHVLLLIAGAVRAVRGEWLVSGFALAGGSSCVDAQLYTRATLCSGMNSARPSAWSRAPSTTNGRFRGANAGPRPTPESVRFADG